MLQDSAPVYVATRRSPLAVQLLRSIKLKIGRLPQYRKQYWYTNAGDAVSQFPVSGINRMLIRELDILSPPRVMG
jgi:hypothetical protein